jgi:tetratricopeptide (TPR) repeat protein
MVIPRSHQMPRLTGFVAVVGYIEHHLGDFTRAAAHYESALDMCRDHGDRPAEAVILTHVGDARHAAGELPQAWQAWQQALAIHDDLRHADAEKGPRQTRQHAELGARQSGLAL